jgi:transposase
MPQPITVPPLDATTLQELTRRFNHTPNPETRLRYQRVRLAQQGYSVSQISPIVLRSHDTVGRVLHRFGEHGLDAVPRRTAPGRKRQVTPAWEAELLRVIELDPRSVGVKSATWTTTLLAEYLTHKTGVSVGLETVRSYLHRHDDVCKRPTWTLKRKAEEQPGYQGNA